MGVRRRRILFGIILGALVLVGAWYSLVVKGMIADGSYPGDYPGTRWVSKETGAWVEVTADGLCYGEIKTEEGKQDLEWLFLPGTSSRGLILVPREKSEQSEPVFIENSLWEGICKSTRTRLILCKARKNEIFPEDAEEIVFLREDMEES